MTNAEIIGMALQQNEMDLTETYLTFAEWKKRGYSVKKGQKAVLVVDLWKPFKKKITDKETGEVTEENRFMLKTSHLFNSKQVEKITKKTASKKKKVS